MKRLLTLYGLAVLVVGGQVLANGIVPDQHNVQVKTGANQVPIIHIAPPNALGVSRNAFQHFNVPSQGAILNNARDAVQTQQAGIIAGNPNITQQAAKLIINEVTHPNPSKLYGILEVAGPTANVVIANPWGITCDGCGFINTPHATLTTGRLQFDADGYLQNYRIEEGSVNIEGSGLKASNIDYVSILTRALKVNAELHANQVQLAVGANQIDAVTGAEIPIVVKDPSFNSPMV
jgi:filamentous hemagglutinin